MVEIESGTILIADPFLKDPNFMRSVVFLCEHEFAGSFGFVLNRKHNTVVGDLIAALDGCDFPVYYGGPVQMDALHFLHLRPDIVHDGVKITDDIYWGGNFEELCVHIQNKTLKQNQVRFFIGYSGWSEGQLENEMKVSVAGKAGEVEFCGLNEQTVGVYGDFSYIRYIVRI